MYSIESFKKKVNMLHIELSDKQYNQYVTYYEMVVEKNKVMNLTGITEFDEFIDKHYIDSLSIVNAVDNLRFRIERYAKVFDSILADVSAAVEDEGF